MRRSFRKPRGLVAIAAASALALALSACGGDTTDPQKTDSPTTPATTESQTQAPAGDPVQIDYLHRLPDSDGMVKVSEIVDKWNAEHPNIQVKATKFDGEAGEMIKKLETDVKANNAPCLAQVGYAEVPEVFVKDMLEDVTAEAEKYKDQFSGAYGQMNIGGKVVGLPQDTGPLVYLYNEVEFEKLGLKVPTTLDELKAEAKKAAEKGKYIIAFEPDEAQNWLSGQAAAAGGIWYDATGDKWKVNAESEQSMVVANFWQEMLDSKAALVANRWDDAQYTKAMIDGKLIGNIAAAWETGFALDALDSTEYVGQWRVAQMPQFGDQPMTGPDGGSGVAVMKGCAHPAEAMEFNAWFNTQVSDLATQGLVPAGKGTVETPEKMKKQFGGQDVMAELMKANDLMNPNFAYAPGFSAVGAEMNTTAAKVGTGEAKVVDIFKAAQTSSIKALKDAGLPVEE